jgi:hypothetical protein
MELNLAAQTPPPVDHTAQMDAAVAENPEIMSPAPVLPQDGVSPDADDAVWAQEMQKASQVEALLRTPIARQLLQTMPMERVIEILGGGSE